MKTFWLTLIAAAAFLPWRGRAALADSTAFLKGHCYECHDADTKKGGLDLTILKPDPADPQVFADWVTVYDRVKSGEMPPKKKPRPKTGELTAFLNTVSSSLTAFEQEKTKREGRATRRRLNRQEYEETIRDLLFEPYLEVKNFLPEDGESRGFNKSGEALDVSHVQMARYLSAADFALRQTLAPRVERPQTRTNRFYAWDEGEFFGKIKLEGPVNRRTFPLMGLDLRRDIMDQKKPARPDISRTPELREQQAMAVVVSTYEPTEIRFGGFRAPVSGRYKLRVSAYSAWMGPNFAAVSRGRRSEPVSLYAEKPPVSLRALGSFDATPDPAVHEMEVWLVAGETIRPDAARFFRSRPPDFHNPLATPEGMPALAFKWLEVEGPLLDQWPPPGHGVLFGDLPIEKNPSADRAARSGSSSGVSVVSRNPEADAERLLRGFVNRAYRAPVREADVQPFLALIRGALKDGYGFTDAMIAGYTGVLSSPGFLYLHGEPGPLDDFALAERLSYFLWNSAPDDELRSLAARRELHRPAVLAKQTDRLLDDPRSRRFVNAFLDYWLDLRLIAGTAPDEQLYPEYQLDDLLVESMIGETQLFFAELIRRNLGASNLVDSDFAMLNERLATLYGIPGVEGVALRPVALPGGSLRGGLLTQASVLKVTSNGTTTSPVKRGAWIMARVLGKPPHPPPPGVPAVEPDIRGATTIREQLAKHRGQESCAACHRNIDPPGFALESFDVMGAWRSRYRSTKEGDPVEGSGHNGINFHYRLGLPVDASGELAGGRKFSDVRELKRELLADPEQLARNLATQLAVYATGAPIRFSDRPQLARILSKTKKEGYGVRALIHEITRSEMFLNK
jgi:hypothetical protein